MIIAVSFGCADRRWPMDIGMTRKRLENDSFAERMMATDYGIERGTWSDKTTPVACTSWEELTIKSKYVVIGSNYRK